MSSIIVSIILILIVGAACINIWKEKKKGNKCIGCPYSGSCQESCDQSVND